MKHGSLFSGIGGFDLAAEWMGWENVFHCEWNPFGQKVLHHYWPNAETFNDITKSDFTKYHGTIDIISGGFPCQPFSSAGKRQGKEDERYLWGEMLRAIQEIKPKYVVAENVFGITSIDGGLVFNQVCADLENEGYEVQPFIIGAASKNAPHRRYRCWFIAIHPNSKCNGLQYGNKNGNIRSTEETPCGKGSEPTNDIATNGKTSNVTNSDECGLEGGQKQKKNKHTVDGNTWDIFPTQSPICGGDDGVPTELDGITFSKWRSESIKAYGNAIVPQVAYEIFKAIQRTI